MPAISVLLPFFNAQEYLKQSIESILGQTFEDFELILINDGSTDGSLNIAKNFSDPRVRIIDSETNRGIVSSLNIGLECARGNFIGRMDADDVSSLSRFELQMRFLASNHKVGIVGCNAHRIDQFGKRIGFQDMPTSILDVRWSSMFICPFLHSSILLRKEILDTNTLKYDPFYYPAEDYDLWSRFLEHSEGANLSERLISCRTHNRSISSLNHLSQIRKHLLVSERTILSNCKDLPTPQGRLHDLIITAGNLNVSDNQGNSRAELTQDYLDVWEAFAKKYLDSLDFSKLEDMVISKAARMANIPPFQRGMGNANRRIGKLKRSWFFPFLVSLPQKMIARLLAIYQQRFRRIE